MDHTRRKRTRSNSGSSPPPWRREAKSSRHDENYNQSLSGNYRGYGKTRGGFQSHLQRRNQEQEERQMKQWMSQEDDFVLKQSKKKAKIRIKEGRAKPIDQLVLLLSIIDPDRDPLDDDLNTTELDINEPVAFMEELTFSELQDIEQEIQHYIVLEHNEVNLTYWQALKTVSQHRHQEFSSRNSARGIGTVSADIARLLNPKSLEQLQVLESQVHQKLRSDEAIDEEYWEQLLDCITLYKARSHLRKFYAHINQIRLQDFRRQQIIAAHKAQASMNEKSNSNPTAEHIAKAAPFETYEPTPFLKLGIEDRNAAVLDEDEFKSNIVRSRERVVQLGYVAASTQRPKIMQVKESDQARGHRAVPDPHSSVTHTMYDREAAKGVEEDEEVFAGEEEVTVDQRPMWSDKFRPRKPKHFNRVQMGYEWNKYNQTHYDHDNPPPKVVQGYRFNVFYPDLMDSSKAPTYRIERENGRKKGQSFAPAGEEDTCLIRFISGPPYEDIAFRIVDREWDYSAKRERGFKSSFDKGILQLHFQFKKIHYRK